MEHLSSSSAYDYKPVNMSANSEVDDDGVELGAISEPNFNAVDTEELNPYHHNSAGDHTSGGNRHLKFYPSIVLAFASLYDFLSGIVLGYVEHSDYFELVQYLLTKALMSITFGTVLESLSAPPSIFQWFAFIFTSSSPLGILLGAYVIPSMLSSDSLMPAVSYCISFVSALAAGVFLNIAVMNMIPAELYAMDNLPEDENSGTGNSSGQNEKLFKLAAFVLGFVVTISPFYIMQ